MRSLRSSRWNHCGRAHHIFDDGCESNGMASREPSVPAHLRPWPRTLTRFWPFGTLPSKNDVSSGF